MSNEKFIEQFKTIRFCSHYLRSEDSKEIVEKYGELLGDRLASFKKLSSTNKDAVVVKYVENLMMNVVDLSELIDDYKIKVVFHGPRGVGKTTLANKLLGKISLIVPTKACTRSKLDIENNKIEIWDCAGDWGRSWLWIFNWSKYYIACI